MALNPSARFPPGGHFKIDTGGEFECLVKRGHQTPHDQQDRQYRACLLSNDGPFGRQVHPFSQIRQQDRILVGPYG